jgi:hypothetical protein
MAESFMKQREFITSPNGALAQRAFVSHSVSANGAIANAPSPPK